MNAWRDIERQRTDRRQTTGDDRGPGSVHRGLGRSIGGASGSPSVAATKSPQRDSTRASRLEPGELETSERWRVVSGERREARGERREARGERRPVTDGPMRNGPWFLVLDLWFLALSTESRVPVLRLRHLHVHLQLHWTLSLQSLIAATRMDQTTAACLQGTLASLRIAPPLRPTSGRASTVYRAGVVA